MIYSSPVRTIRRLYPAPHSSSSTWDAVFSKPSPASIESFSTGELIVQLGGMLDLGDPRAAHLHEGKCRVSVYVHLIHHPSLGDFVVDTGLNRGYQIRRAGSVRGLAAPFLPIPGFQKPGFDLRSRLDALGIKPTAVFYTHLHFDHSAGSLDLSAGVRHIVGMGEPMFGIPVLAQGNFFKDVPVIEELDFTSAVEMPILGKVIDLLGDGSLWAILTPGHSPGHVSYLCNGVPNPVLIAGDAISMKSALDLGLGPGTYTSDHATACKSADRLRAFASEYPNVRILTGHEL